MKKFNSFLLLTSLFSLVLFIGCSKQNQQDKVVKLSDQSETVVYGDKFPPQMVGIWSSDTKEWEIEFDSVGHIKRFIHPIGRVEIVPGKITKVPMKDGGEGFFEPGEVTVTYSELNKELTCTFEIKSFTVEIGGAKVEGKSNDVLIGKITDDEFWSVDWASDPQFIISNPEYNKYELPIDANENIKGITFTKKPATVAPHPAHE